jgi:hypothetical protein
MVDKEIGWAKTRETRQSADRGAIEQHCLTFWRRINRNSAKWVTRGVECLQKPPFATGTYPAWYTAALRTSAQFPDDARLKTRRRSLTSRTILFDFAWRRAPGQHAIA